MAGTADDPFDWDADQLATQLFTSGSKWLPSSPNKFPPFDEFSKALKDNDIDGELFLTYGKTHAEYRDLWADLGVNKPQYRLHLSRAVDSLRKKSGKYKEFVQNERQEDEEEDGASINSQAKSPIPSKRPAEDGPTSTEEPSPKKRRVVPLAVKEPVVLNPLRHMIPNEADPLGGWPSDLFPTRTLKTTSWSNTYLGLKPLKWIDILQGQGGDGSIDEPFQFVANKDIQPGHSLRVNMAMKSIFRRNVPRLQTMIGTFGEPVQPDSFMDIIIPTDPGMMVTAPEDPILGVYGEEEGDSDVDSETFREMEEEREEDERRKANAPKTLAESEVCMAVDAAIEAIVAKWSERKLPVLERKAYSHWTKSRRAGTRMLELRNAAARMEVATAQIKSGRREIQQMTWSSTKDIERQVSSLEQSIINRENERWLLNTLDGPMPPKPETLPRVPRPARPQEVPVVEGEEEVLTSESEAEYDDMAGFIVDDEMDEMAVDADDLHPEPVPAAPRTSRKIKSEAMSDHDDVVDLTQDDVKGAAPTTPKPVVIDLITPDPPRSRPRSIQGFNGRIPPRAVWDRLPGWTTETSQRKLLICMLWELKKNQRAHLHHIAQDCAEFPSTFWQNYVVTGVKLPDEGEPELVNNLATRLFESYRTCKALKPRCGPLRKLSNNPDAIDNNMQEFGMFFDILLEAIPRFPETNWDIEEDYGLESVEEEEAGEDGTPSKSKKRAGAAPAPVVLDQTALQMREGDRRRIEEQEKRRNELRQQLSRHQTIPRDKSRLIVNESKKEAEGFVYVTGEPARLIKDHQIDGVRFLWNHIIAGSAENPQGCVLAHTMGLGKTMQVITFLMAVVEASKSSDPSIRSQIPKHLRRSRTIILCPPTLMINWHDELLLWDPERVLGEVLMVGSNTKTDAPDAIAARGPHIQKWDKEGGVLIIGYRLFPKLLATPEGDILRKTPSIVVADEAHYIKNVTSKIREACTQFKTKSRVALTGSPLSNNVTEYYSMIDWVAPNYMGPPSEFHEMYTRPIETGLWKDCTRSEQRKAYMLLQVLRKTISPKVHRATIHALKGEFPSKREFVITVPITNLQKKLYNKYVELIQSNGGGATFRTTWGVLANLQLILNHPRCFSEKVNEVIDGRRQALLREPREEGDVSVADEEAAMPIAWAKDLKAIMSSVRDFLDLGLSWRVKHLIHIFDESRKAKEKVLVFSQRIKTIDFLENLCRQQKRPCYRLDGQTKVDTRVPMINQFNKKGTDTSIFLISTKAGGVGLNIHSANRVVIMDFSHNPMHEQQAIGRAYRIGQKKPVFVYWFVTAGTFEEKLQGRSVFKRQLADRVVDDMKFKSAGELDTEGWIRPVVEDKDRRSGDDAPPADIGDELGKDHVLDGILKTEKGVKKVITTDTFQIELDPDDVKLTDEEDKVVQNMVEQVEMGRSGKPWEPPVQPSPSYVKSQQTPVVPSNGHLPSTTRTPPSSTTHTPFHQFRSGVFAGDVGEWRPGLNGTRPSDSELFMPEASSTQAQMLLTPDAHNRCPAFTDFQRRLMEIMDQLDWYRLASLDLVKCRPLSMQRYAEGAAIQISRERREMQSQGQHDAHYQLLRECINACPQLVEALVCQAVSISYLASAREADLRALTQKLSHLSREKLLEYIMTRRTRLQDPQHLSAALQRRNRERIDEGRLARVASPKSKDDEIIMRQVADRRKRRLAGMDANPSPLNGDALANVPSQASPYLSQPGMASSSTSPPLGPQYGVAGQQR